MDKLRILIVEDELIIANDLKEILEEKNYQVINIASSFNQAIKVLEKDSVDLALLDIQISGDKDGVNLGHELREKFKLPFVYISSHTDHATLEKVKATNPYGFLVKPFEDEDVVVAIEMALNNFEKEQNTNAEQLNHVIGESLFVRQKNLSVKIKYDEILFASADANYCTLFTTDQKYVLRSTLKELEMKLDKNHFYRCHKSYIINLNRISAINSDFVMIESHKLPLGREQQAWLMEKINRL